MKRRYFLERMGVGLVALRADAYDVVEKAGRLVEGMPPQDNAVGEALTFMDGIGLEVKAARLRYLRRRWMDAVAGVPGVRFYTANDDRQAGALATMGIEGMGADELTDVLQRRYAIHVRPRFVPGEWEGIRVTPNVFSTLEEVDGFSRAVREIAAGP